MSEFHDPAPGRPYIKVQAGTDTDPLSVDHARLFDVYRQHGAVLLRGFDLDLTRFRALTDQWCSSSVFNESPDRQLLDAEHNVQSVNGGLDAFPLHPELSREPWKPDVCFFACLSAPARGGETTICDGTALARALPGDVRDGLARHRLLYIQVATPQTLQYWLGDDRPDDARLARPPEHCPYRFIRTPRGIVRAFTRPALHRPMFSTDAAFGNFLLFANDYLKRKGFPVLETGQPVPDVWLDAVRTAAEPLTVPIQWQKGDVIILDNSRFMHGRRRITDSADRLIASYFGYLRDAIPDAEEPPNAPWRQQMFRPPVTAMGQPGGAVSV